MTNYKLRFEKRTIQPGALRFFTWMIFFAFSGFGAFAQVSATIDSTTIEIGNEIRYKMQVEADSTQIVVFPEGQTFTPLEVIESQKIDTSRNGKRFNLTKEYALTQFDSGHYTIPRQKIMIGDKVFFTDSLKVEVRDILVDTTKQKMYEIKPLVDVDAKFAFNWKKWFLWIGISLLILGLISFFIFRRKKRKANKEDELPPYERAILALQKIDESHLLEKDSHKEYYSQLSDTARKYIDEEVYDHAMESTTDELITRLDEEIRSGNLNLDKTTIEELKNVLKTADMAKFAKSKPDIITAKSDRNVIEQVIHKTKSAIPEPTEEELLADEEYRKTVAEKKRRKKIILGSLGAVAVVAITLLIFIFVKGYDVVKDTLLGHPTKELAETEWITSAYGSPPVTVATPRVLIRNAYQMTEEQKQTLKGNETFVYGSLAGNFYVVVTTIQYKQPAEIKLNEVVEGVVGKFESIGAKNISVKDEEYETLGGAKGVKVFGDLEIVNPVTKKKQKNSYLMLNFAENGGFQQITLVYDIEDRYAKDVAERIINSVELKNTK
ncbi:BatD family protein [Aquimarina sp. Aq78]|uniref:BatD family protein n=1 Tax=Aquimarina sp. Aq78 TaxID=1191889 RepID=UPI000D54F5F8|nr:BatD family protein [Aquimarina sp. Aq78]